MKIKKITYLNLIFACFLSLGLIAQSGTSSVSGTRHLPPVGNFIVKGLCAGDSTHFIDKTSGGYAIYWGIANDKGDTIYSSYEKNISYFFTKIGPYSVTMTSYNGHYTTITRNLYVDTVPHADFLFRYCYNQLYNFSTCSDQFVWILPDSSISTLDFPSYKFDKAGTYPITLIAKKGLKADTLTSLVKVAPDSLGFPNATFTAFLKDTNLFVFDFTALDTSASYYYWWFGDGQFDNTSNSPKVTHLLDTSKYAYPVTLSITNGCGSNNYDLDVFATLCLSPSNATVTDITSGSALLHWKGIAIYYTIQLGLQGFNLGSGTFYSSDSNYYKVTGLTANLNYSYYIRANCDTVNTTWIGPFNFTTLPVGINEGHFVNPVLIFPNPSNGQFIFQNLEKENQIEVYDSMGRMIYQTTSKNNSCVIDLSRKDKGIYLYKIINEKKEIQQGKISLQ